jgi:uncharacterized protein (DUF952 family)
LSSGSSLPSILTPTAVTAIKFSMSVYKILRQDEWQALQEKGQTKGSSDDVRDGYVHLSTAPQVAGTLLRHFSGEESLWLLEVEQAIVGPDLRWETARDGDKFPHLYRALELGDVARAAPIHAGQPLPFGLS